MRTAVAILLGRMARWATRLRGGGSAVPGRVLLAVGPEGGWNEFELSLLESRGFQRASMGSRTLRTDTACIALLTMVNSGLRS